MASTSLTQRAADEYCRMLTRGHYENFAVASWFVPRGLRLDLMRFYAFCRTTDDLGDESGSPQVALRRLQRWRDDAQALFAGEAPVHPVLFALQDTIARNALDAAPFLDLIAANEQDQRVTSYSVWPELERYCQLSAAPVGRVVLRLFGIATPLTEKLSDDVCIGLQLANHAQDVSRDAHIGRCYLLQSDLDELGQPGAVRALVQRARSLLASGRALEPYAPRSLRLQLASYRLGGLAICAEIEKMQFATHRARPHVPARTKGLLVLRALLETLFHSPQASSAETA